MPATWSRSVNCRACRWWRRRGMRLLGALPLAATLTASAADLPGTGDAGRWAALGVTLKLTGTGSANPDDDQLFPDRYEAMGALRTRLRLTATPAAGTQAEIAYEHRAVLHSRAPGALGLGGNAAPVRAEAPWRLTQMDWEIAEGDAGRLAWRHEIDRAMVACQPDWGQVILGRQAIGLGRGVLFSALDAFAPFSPAEVDREWRRGVDALRIEHRLADTASAELLAVFGGSWEDSAVLGRVRGYAGEVDAEVVGGRRARDAILGAAVSAVLGDAEAHGEAALFRTPEDQPEGGLFGRDDWVGKLVAGASTMLDVGTGLTILGEYHYSGFGIGDAADAPLRFADPDFARRYRRGDSQTLGRHTLGLQASYVFSEVWSGRLLVLESLEDGSGLVSPVLVWSGTQHLTVTLSASLPWGAGPSDGRPRSVYGTSAWTAFAQMSVHF